MRLGRVMSRLLTNVFKLVLPRHENSDPDIVRSDRLTDDFELLSDPREIPVSPYCPDKLNALTFNRSLIDGVEENGKDKGHSSSSGHA